MKINRQFGLLPVLLGAFGLAACGGSSSGNSGGNVPTVNTPTQVTAVGSITGFGSVFVNGVKYEVASDTRVSIEGEADSMGDDSGLRLGMKVTVTASANNGVRTARTIEFDEDLKGPIESIAADPGDPTIGTFTVLGQVVVVDAATAFDDDIGNNDGVAGVDFRDLQIGMIVEVSGFPTDTGFLATRVDRELDAGGGNPTMGQPGIDGDELELKGFVDDVAANGSSITVNGVVFVINASTFFDNGLSANADLVGVFVEVKADISGGQYIAVRVEREDDFDDDDRNGEFEIEGILQSVDTVSSPNTFTVNGITVPVTDASTLVGLVGMRVEIKGSFNADHVLVLREAEQDIEDNVRSEDNVTSVDIGGVSFTTRLGLVIQPTGGSRVEDKAGNDDSDHLTPQQFINRLQPGDRVEVRGHDSSASGVTWTRIERDELAADNDDFDCELRGTVSSVDGDASAFSFTIQGVTVQTGRVAENNFEGANDQPIGRAAFFEQLQPGVVVEAQSFEGNEFCMTNMLDAREVEFEPANGS